MRRFTQVKRKEIAFRMSEWAEVEKRAAELSLKTGTYIKRMAVSGQITYYNIQDTDKVINALRIIGGNINQIARKANEINNVNAEDVEKLKGDYDEICHTLSLFLSTLPSIAA